MTEPSRPLNLLVIEDLLADFLVLERNLRKQGIDAHCRQVGSFEQLAACLAEGGWDAILSDYHLPGMDFWKNLAHIRSSCPDVPIIMVSGTIGEEAAIKALKSGITDFILKDNMTRLASAIERALNEIAELQARRAVEQALREKDELLRDMSALANIGGWTFDPATGRGGWTEELVRICEVDPSFAASVADFLQGDGRRKFEAALAATIGSGEPFDIELEIVTAQGNGKWLRAVGVPCHEGGRVARLRGSMQDVTDRKRYEKQIDHQATHDALTGLPNRVLGWDRLEQAIAAAKRNNACPGILFLDMDRFKNVNDSLGHERGDGLLQEVAARLRALMRAGDTVSRQGGDEFIIVIPGAPHRAVFADLAAKILNTVATPYSVGGHELSATFSIGISVYPDDGADASTLIRNADAAMYAAKANGRNNFQFYSPEMNRKAAERFSLEGELRHALGRREFEAYYQPKVAAADGRLTGAEALIRWNHPEKGLLPPAQFIPIAEESGLIIQIGQWIAREVCRQNQEWLRSGLSCVPVSVNLSAIQFRDRSLVDALRTLLAETGVPPELLELELTESFLMQETVVEALNKLKELGIGLSIDDFGTGYSSLSYLKRFPIDTLKIDRVFVRDIPHEDDDAAIVDAIISMGHSLNLSVIAEGVETEEQLRFLKERGCDQFQGHFFSAPMPAAHFASMLDSRL